MPDTRTNNSTWDSRGFGSRLQFQIFYFLIRLGGRVAAYALLVFVVAWYVLAYPAKRRKSEFYISRRFPSQNRWQRLKSIYCHCLEFGKSLVDRSVIMLVGDKTTTVSFPERDAFRELAQGPDGVLLLHAHVGCWQAAMADLLFIEKPVTLVIHRAPGDNNELYFERHRGHQDIRIIDPDDQLASALHISAALGKGEIVNIMGDRIFGSARNAIPVEFLGETAWFPVSPYKIAATIQARLVVLLVAKTAMNQYEISFKELAVPAKSLGQPNEFYSPCAREFVATLESFCRKYPYQFFNFHDMWKQP